MAPRGMRPDACSSACLSAACTINASACRAAPPSPKHPHPHVSYNTSSTQQHPLTGGPTPPSAPPPTHPPAPTTHHALPLHHTWPPSLTPYPAAAPAPPPPRTGPLPGVCERAGQPHRRDREGRGGRPRDPCGARGGKGAQEGAARGACVCVGGGGRRRAWQWWSAVAVAHLLHAAAALSAGAMRAQWFARPPSPTPKPHTHTPPPPSGPLPPCLRPCAVGGWVVRGRWPRPAVASRACKQTP